MIEQTSGSNLIIERRAGRLAGALGLLLALALVAGSVLPAHAQGIPPMPHGFAGTVSTVTPPELLPEGTLVEAFLAGVKKAETTVDADGKYEILVRGTLADDGREVTFRVEGVLAHQKPRWRSGQLDELDLTITSTPGDARYSVTMAVDPSGTGTASDVTANPPYGSGVEIDIKAVPAEGYGFVNWTAQPQVVFADANSAETSFTMPESNVTITAHFDVAYTVTTQVDPAGGGTVLGQGEYARGAQVRIKGQPAAGYGFVDWTASPVVEFANATAAETTFTMPDSSVTVTANFELVYYTLTMAVTPADTGTAVDLTGDASYAMGAEISIKAEPAEGYRFVNWTAPAGSFANQNAATTTFTMPAENVTVTANFQEGAAEEFTLTVAVQPLVGGILNPPVGTYLREEGETVTIQVVAPTSGYQFLYWMSSPGVTFSNANAPSTSFTMPGNDLTVTAVFAQADDPVQAGCFIATAAYGTPAAAEIDVLREFRDAVLLENTPGSRFVDFYYRLSPPVADLISGSSFLRTVVRELLVDPAVWLVEATGGLWRR